MGSAVEDDPTLRTEKMSPAGSLAACLHDRIRALLLVTFSAPRLDTHQISTARW
jgi:hypothetical protein